MVGDAKTPLVAQVIDALDEPVLLLDQRGRVRQANAAAHEWFGTWIDGQSYVAVLRQPDLLAPVEDAFFQGKAGRSRFSHSSGAVETLFEVSITPLVETGLRAMVLLVFRDVSGRRDEESRRRDFVANVSHELKTPLTAVRGFIETLQGPAREDGAAQARFLGLMAQEVARMNRLVSDLLALSRLEGLTRKRPTERTDLVVIVEEAIEMISAGAEVEQIDIVTDMPERAEVAGDRDQLVQVATNLIENAVKYGGKPGRVTIRVLPLDRDPVLRQAAWVWEVADDGPGVPAEHLPRLTERFYRVDTGRSRDMGGTGLGLAIVKHIVNRHRGRLRIDSQLGQGTTVRVTLPIFE